MKIIGDQLERVIHFKCLGMSTEDECCVETDHSPNRSRFEKLQEMQESIVRIESIVPTKLIRTANSIDQSMRQKRWLQRSDKKIEVNDTRMLLLRWMYGVTRKENIWNEHLRRTNVVSQASKMITERRECQTGKGM